MRKKRGRRGRGTVKEEGRERVKSILIPLIHTRAVLPTGIFTCTHRAHTVFEHWSDLLLLSVQLTSSLDVHLMI